MVSLRSNAGKIAWLALFALACQLLLSFDHVHFGKNAGKIWTAASGAFASSDQSSSPQGPPLSTTDDFCAICASINLAGTLIVPAVTWILTPVSVRAELPNIPADVEPRSMAHLLFNARGPP